MLELTKKEEAYIETIQKLLADIYFENYPTDVKTVDLAISLVLEKGKIGITITIKGD